MLFYEGYKRFICSSLAMLTEVLPSNTLHFPYVSLFYQLLCYFICCISYNELAHERHTVYEPFIASNAPSIIRSSIGLLFTAQERQVRFTTIIVFLNI